MITTTRDQDIELAFIREFSVLGNSIGSVLSSEDRRERIRIAIFANNLHDKIFRDTEMTYATAYRKCYGKALEMRRYPRDLIPSHRSEDDETEDA